MRSRRFAPEPTTAAIHQLWQTDFTYLNVTGWSWFSLDALDNSRGTTRLEALHDDRIRKRRDEIKRRTIEQRRR